MNEITFCRNPCKTETCFFHLRSEQASDTPHITSKGLRIGKITEPTYLGVYLDQTLSYTSRSQKRSESELQHFDCNTLLFFQRSGCQQKPHNCSELLKNCFRKHMFSVVRINSGKAGGHYREQDSERNCRNRKLDQNNSLPLVERQSSPLIGRATKITEGKIKQWTHIGHPIFRQIADGHHLMPLWTFLSHTFHLLSTKNKTLR